MNYTIRNLLVASVLMLIGILAVTSFIRAERRDLSRGQQQVQIWVATKDIPAGTPADDLESGGWIERKDVLREDAPPNPVVDVASLKQLVSNETIYAGEPVNVTAFDKTAGLKPTAQIKGNERLFTVPILAANDVAGLIRPGDHVDLAASLQNGGSGFKHVVLARDVEVIETPTSLLPEGTEADQQAPEADGDTKLYVFKATDREAQNIQLGLSASDQHQIFMWLTPANGGADSDLAALTQPEAVR